MEILFYQISILVIICVAAFFGRNARNNVVLIIAVFTIIQVFMLWLGVLQFITIWIGYSISQGILGNKRPANIPVRNYDPSAYENQDPEMQKAIDAVILDISKRAQGIDQFYYYIERAKEHGPFSRKQMRDKVSYEKLNKMFFVRNSLDKDYTKGQRIKDMTF